MRKKTTKKPVLYGQRMDEEVIQPNEAMLHATAFEDATGGPGSRIRTSLWNRPMAHTLWDRPLPHSNGLDFSLLLHTL